MHRHTTCGGIAATRTYHTACTGNTGSFDAYEGLSLDRCEALCAQNTGCLAYEHSRTRVSPWATTVYLTCELHNEQVTLTEPDPLAVCRSKTLQPGWGWLDPASPQSWPSLASPPAPPGSANFVAPWRADGRCRFAPNARECSTHGYTPKWGAPCLVWQGCAHSAEQCQQLCAQRAECLAFEFNVKNPCGAFPCELHGVVPDRVDADPRYTCKIKAQYGDLRDS